MTVKYGVPRGSRRQTGAAHRLLALLGRPRSGARGAARSRAAAAGGGAAEGDGNQGGPGDELLPIEPPAYFRALCGIAVPAVGGIVNCPLPDHDDAYASCQVFAEAERGWWSYGCARGGRIYHLASLLRGGPWGRELRADRASGAPGERTARLGRP
jgi:hypothetical protein